MGIATSLANALINEVFGGVNYAPVATVYIALSTTAPTAAGANVTEPTANGYARVAVLNNATNFPTATGGSKTNGTPITFPEATGAWGGGNITHFAIFDAATAGTFMGFGSVTTPKTVVAGDTANFPAGALSFSMV